MQVQERGPGFRQHPFENSDRPEEALSGSAKEARWDARWEPLQGWSHPRTAADHQTAVRHQQPATNPRLSGFPSQPAHASARTNDHLYSTVSSVDVQVPWDRLQCSRVQVLGQDTQSVSGVGRCSKKLFRASCLCWRHEVQATFLSCESYDYLESW